MDTIYTDGFPDIPQGPEVSWEYLRTTVAGEG